MSKKYLKDYDKEKGGSESNIGRYFTMKKNFTLDLILFIAGLICIITGIILDFHLIPGGREARKIYKDIHVYSGYIMAIGLIFHLVWHKDWIKAATKKFLKRS